MKKSHTPVKDIDIENLPKPFGAVATVLASGSELWLRTGWVIDSVRASIALPGMFTPVKREGALLVDGDLVNPVPVSLCRALGADIVIAVDLNPTSWAAGCADAQGKRPKHPRKPVAGATQCSGDWA